MDATFRDWAGLSLHIVDMMVIKLDRYSDYVHFCGVCQEWRYAAFEANVVHKVNLDILKVSRRKLPMLIYTIDESNYERRGLFSDTYRTTFDVKLPFLYKHRFAGSSHGWLFCLEKNMVLTLVNPINNGCISLPPIKEPRQVFTLEWRKCFFDFYIRKGILLLDSDASPSSFGVVVIYGLMGKVAYFKSGEPSWNFINMEDFFCNDIIHYKGKLYGVGVDSKFGEIDIPSRTIKTIVPKTHSFANVVHLVESQDGELLMIRRSWLENSDLEDDLEARLGENFHVEEEHGENFHVEEEDGENFHVQEEHGEDFHVEEHVGNADYGENESYDSESGFTPPVRLFDDDIFPRTCEFKVFKMTHLIEKGSATWVEIDNIGQQALFVGDNQSVSVSTTDFPGCIPNSIYYITQHHIWIFPYVYGGPNEDSGIFNLKNQGFYLHHVLDSSEKYMQPPIWFLPNPQELNL